MPGFYSNLGNGCPSHGLSPVHGLSRPTSACLALLAAAFARARIFLARFFLRCFETTVAPASSSDIAVAVEEYFTILRVRYVADVHRLACRDVEGTPIGSG